MRRKVEWGRGREDKRESRGRKVGRERWKKIKMDEKRKTEKGNGVKRGRGKMEWREKGDKERGILFTLSLNQDGC